MNQRAVGKYVDKYSCLERVDSFLPPLYIQHTHALERDAPIDRINDFIIRTTSARRQLRPLQTPRACLQLSRRHARRAQVAPCLARWDPGSLVSLPPKRFCGRGQTSARRLEGPCRAIGVRRGS